MRKKLVLLTFLSAFLLSTLSVVLVSAQDEITLRWRTRPDNQAEADLYTGVSESVDADWDGVALQYEAGGSETAGYQATILTEVAAGTAPDVFWIPGTDIATFANEGAILNLAEIAAAMEGFDGSVFYEQQMNELTYNPETMARGMESGALWGLPRDASAMALYYNADLFDEAGMDYPEVQLANGEWNWETFRETSEAISALSTGDNQVYGFGMNGWWANWLVWINANNGNERNYYFNEDASGCGLGEAATTEAMAFLADLYANDLAVPFGTDSEPPFIAGNVGMFMNGRWATPNTVAQAEFNWNVAELPAAPNGMQSNWLFWGAYVVNANTEHPAEAFELVTRLTSTDVQAQVSALGANIPSRNTDEAREAFLGTLMDVKPDLNNAAFSNALQYGVAEAPLWTANYQQIDAAVGAEVSRVMSGELSAEDFTATVCDVMAPFFSN